jgi:hypothetical protein
MSDYTPTTAQVRRAWTDWHDLTGANSPAAFDRWLAEHDAQVAERAVEDVAQRLEGDADLLIPSGYSAALRSAARIARSCRAAARIARETVTADGRD